MRAYIIFGFLLGFLLAFVAVFGLLFSSIERITPILLPARFLLFPLVENSYFANLPGLANMIIIATVNGIFFAFVGGVIAFAKKIFHK